ncbi:kinase-like domain-containing protein [Ganoderma leucocontextum]|nr:kinase-like domain-containing protein [Ganoderma leucocontextum]
MSAASCSSSRTPRLSPPQATSVSNDEDSEDDSSSCHSQSSTDEDVNIRMSPNWCSYRCVIASRGFRLDTCKDVKEWYHQYWAIQASEGHTVTKDLPGYIRACGGQDENELCRDAGLPDCLFRGTQCSTGVKVVIKAVHLNSREYDVIRQLSCPALRNHPMNHCIPVLDLVEVFKDALAFIVMEEWPAPLTTSVPANLGEYLNFLRYCIEHTTFMHMHDIAHLDISPRNIVTDFCGRYACIDYECSMCFDGTPEPRIRHARIAEPPPELERGEASDPFKVDVFGLGVLMLRTMKLTGYNVPELYPLIKSMIRNQFEQRPSAEQVLFAFNTTISQMHPPRLACEPALNDLRHL